MKKRYKAIVAAVLAVLLAFSCLAFVAACGDGEDESAPAMMTSEDGKYDLYMNSLGRAWLTEHGKEDRLIEGNFRVREENSALTLSFNDEVVDVTNYRLSYGFTYSNDEAGIAETSFAIHRGTLMKALGQNGVVLDTQYSVQGDTSGGGGGGGFGAVSLLMSTIGSGTKEGYGKLEIKMLKIQGNWDYKYTKEDGLVIDATDSQKALVGSGAVRYDEATETYYVTYDIAKAPPFGNPAGEAPISKADIENALLLAD